MRRVASIPSAIRAAWLAEARRSAPHECCGLLVGRGARVAFAIPTRNVASRPRTRFRIDPAEHVAIRRTLRQLTPQLAIVGVYHSHPQGPAVPSRTDVAEANYPDWLYAIVDGSRRASRVFEIRAGVVRRLRVRWRRPPGGRSGR